MGAARRKVTLFTHTRRAGHSAGCLERDGHEVDKDTSLAPGAPAEPGAVFLPLLLLLPTCPLPWCRYIPVQAEPKGVSTLSGAEPGPLLVPGERPLLSAGYRGRGDAGGAPRAGAAAGGDSGSRVTGAGEQQLQGLSNS